MKPTAHSHSSAPREPAARRGRLVFFAFIALSIFFLAAEHRAHLFGVLPWLILLLCPLMHIFMHGSHGHGNGNGNGNGQGAHQRDGKGDQK